jgi:hypothetical protein
MNPYLQQSFYSKIHAYDFFQSTWSEPAMSPAGNYRNTGKKNRPKSSGPERLWWAHIH